MLGYTWCPKEAECQQTVLNMKQISNTVHARAKTANAAATAVNASRRTYLGGPCQHVRGILLDPGTKLS